MVYFCFPSAITLHGIPGNAPSSLFSNLLLLRWGLPGIPGRRLCLQTFSAPKNWQWVQIPTNIGCRRSKNNFTPILQYRVLMLQSYSQEKSQAGRGNEEITQGGGSSSLLVPPRGYYLHIDAKQYCACSLFWHNISCFVLYLISWINQPTHLPDPQMKFLGAPVSKTKLVHVPVVSDSFPLI